MAPSDRAPGTRVRQPAYGLGTIVEATDRHTVIDFDDYGRRLFAARLLVLETVAEAPTTTPAPAVILTDAPAPPPAPAPKKPRAKPAKKPAK